MSEGYDQNRVRSALADAVGCTFADMVFIDVEPAAPVADAQDGPEVRVAIDLLRPMSARLELRLPEALRVRVQDILFDGAENAGMAPRDDSMLEILNVIAGQFISRYFGPKTEIKLELPQYLFFHAADEGEVIQDLPFDAEGLPLRALLSSIRYRY